MKKFLLVLLVLILLISITLNVFASWNRFTINKQEKGYLEIDVYMIKDNKTGVCYLSAVSPNNNNITVIPMYDLNGKILVEK